jgi:hypothetical protein
MAIEGVKRKAFPNTILFDTHPIVLLGNVKDGLMVTLFALSGTVED